MSYSKSSAQQSNWRLFYTNIELVSEQNQYGTCRLLIFLAKISVVLEALSTTKALRWFYVDVVLVSRKNTVNLPIDAFCAKISAVLKELGTTNELPNWRFYVDIELVSMQKHCELVHCGIFDLKVVSCSRSSAQ